MSASMGQALSQEPEVARQSEMRAVAKDCASSWRYSDIHHKLKSAFRRAQVAKPESFAQVKPCTF